MPHLIGYVDNANQLAHYELLETIKTFAAANGWQVLRYDTAIANRELILKGVGYTGQEEIYVGLHTYQDAEADYYNLAAASFTGYVAANSFVTQPGVIRSGVPCHNQRIDYWLTVNPQRIAGALKVGTPVYESFYIGKMLPYARPSQYPYPMICGGMLDGVPATRFSDTGHSVPYKGTRNNLRMRFNDGLWKIPTAYPWNNAWLAGATSQLRPAGDHYALLPIELSDANGIYGALDGVCHIAGFDNAVENTLAVDGVDWVVIQDVSRTGFNDYYALRMDA
ncbi:MAG: hypothetical protein LBQ81_12175 [Zoogloeaceae bacterium]|jgi:hypothetical protein|nr:hypothetical protein [Zoogloeaceae bacterium]